MFVIFIGKLLAYQRSLETGWAKHVLGYFPCLATAMLKSIRLDPQSQRVRGRRPEVFCEKGVLINPAKFAEKHLC